VNDLMTLADIAEMAHCSLRHARDVLVRLPGFPDEAPLSTPRNRLWLRSEVRAFVHRKPARIPHMSLKAA
jgi:hypothetical protein